MIKPTDPFSMSAQLVSLQAPNCVSLGTAAHELLHALGKILAILKIKVFINIKLYLRFLARTITTRQR